MSASSAIDKLHRELIELANEQFDSSEYRKLLAAHFSRETAARYEVQRTYFVANRRDCWGYAQGASPLEVKRLIWAHEQEELMGSDGVPDHVSLSRQEAGLFGVSAADWDRIPPTATAQACFWAWIQLASNRPWLEAVASCSILEWVVSDEIIRGGGIVRRLSERMHQDLGMPLKEQPNSAVHVVADIEHANLLVDVLRRHGETEEARQAILRGAKASLTVERAYRGHLGDLIAGAPA